VKLDFQSNCIGNRPVAVRTDGTLYPDTLNDYVSGDVIVCYNSTLACMLVRIGVIKMILNI